MKYLRHKSFFKEKTFVLGLLIFFGCTVFSQHQNIPINHIISQKIEKGVLAV